MKYHVFHLDVTAGVYSQLENLCETVEADRSCKLSFKNKADGTAVFDNNRWNNLGHVNCEGAAVHPRH